MKDMKKLLFIIIAFVAVSDTLAQTTFGAGMTLQQCRNLAHDNYPAIRQYGIIEKSCEFTLDNISKGWLPRIGVTGSVAAFTDVLAENPKLSQFGVELKNHIFGGMVNVTQNVYDGGRMAAEKRVVQAQTTARRHHLDMELYDINERVDQLFFSILLLEKKLELNNLLLEDINVAGKTVNSMLVGGIVNKGDVETIDIERQKALQQRDALEAQREACRRVLQVFCGTEIGELADTESESMAEYSQTASGESPTMSYYSAQEAVFAAQKRSLDSKLLPRISLFAMGTLHSDVSPLLNSGMLAGGLTFSWNIGALYTRKNDLRQIRLSMESNDSQRATFTFNQRLKKEEVNGTIITLEKQITRDSAIIELLQSQLDRMRKKVGYGTETVAELTRSINALSTARQQKVLHQIQLQEERCRLNTIKNN